MVYESPIIREIGSVESLTMGSLATGPERDNFQWWISRSRTVEVTLQADPDPGSA